MNERVISGAMRPAWQSLVTGVTASLRGLSAVSEHVAWVSGSDGTVLRTTDGGHEWTRCTIPGADEFDFRDVHAFDADTAIIASAGLPARFFRTEDGGVNWLECYSDAREGVFFDAIEFWDESRGLAFGDPIAGRPLIIATRDGGRSWQPVSVAGIPTAVTGEAGFAASGTCLAVEHGGHAWIGTGGQRARVFRSADFGETWRVFATPMRSGSASTGIFSLQFSDREKGIAVGGDYRDERSTRENAIFTRDGGVTWQPVSRPPAGYRSVVRSVPGTDGLLWIAAGPTGCDVSVDRGEHWHAFGNVGFHTVDFARDGGGWAAGSDGRVARWCPHENLSVE